MNGKTQILVALIVFAVIDIILLAYIDGSFSDVRYACLVFINISFVVALVAPILVPKSDGSHHQGATSAVVILSYVVIQLIIGIIFIITDWDNLLVVCIIQGVMFAAAIILLLLLHSIDIPSAADECSTREYREEYIVETRENMSVALKNTTDVETKKVVEKTSDHVASTPRKNKAETIKFDNEILLLSREILDYAKLGDNKKLIDSCKEMNDLIEKRNVAFKKA